MRKRLFVGRQAMRSAALGDGPDRRGCL